jgi:hypothetical protein
VTNPFAAFRPPATLRRPTAPGPSPAAR